MTVTLYRVKNFQRAFRAYSDGWYSEYRDILQQSPTLDLNSEEGEVWEKLLREAQVDEHRIRMDQNLPKSLSGCSIDMLIRLGRATIRLRKKEGLAISTHKKIVAFLQEGEREARNAKFIGEGMSVIFIE